MDTENTVLEATFVQAWTKAMTVEATGRLWEQR